MNILKISVLVTPNKPLIKTRTMKPIEISISKNFVILTLLTILSGVIVFDQIRYRRLETQLKTIVSSFPITDHINPDDIPDTLTTMSYAMPDYDSILEANKLLKKKVDFYFEFYRKHFPPNKN